MLIYLDNSLYITGICRISAFSWCMWPAKNIFLTCPNNTKLKKSAYFGRNLGYKHLLSTLLHIFCSSAQYFETRDPGLYNDIKNTDIILYLDIVIAEQNLFKFQFFWRFKFYINIHVDEFIFRIVLFPFQTNFLTSWKYRLCAIGWYILASDMHT